MSNNRIWLDERNDSWARSFARPSLGGIAEIRVSDGERTIYLNEEAALSLSAFIAEKLIDAEND